jgi:hypothetical protein
VCFQLPLKTLERVDELVAASGDSRSAVLVELVARGLERPVDRRHLERRTRALREIEQFLGPHRPV